MLQSTDAARRRSNRAEVRNPILTLPALRALQALDPTVRALLVALLRDLQRDARARAQLSWDTHKPALASYWAAAGVYAGHIAKALRPRPSKRGKRLSMTVSQPGYPELAADDWADASNRFSQRRDDSGLGASQFPDGMVLIDGIAVARIGYNGRIWPLAPWVPDMQPLYDNRIAA